MSNAQRGAYIDLLCTAWSEESCTLPAEVEALHKLSHWEGTAQEFEPVLACFPLTRNRKRRYNPRLFNERQEAVSYRTRQSAGGRKGMESRWATKPARKTRTPPKELPSNWLEELRKEPIYAHVNWEREMGKIAVWHKRKENTHRLINHKFVTNWMNKIEPPLANGHAASLSCPHHPALTFADPSALKRHNFDYHPQFRG